MKRRIEVNLPTSWQDITLKEYLAYQKALKPYEGVEEYNSIVLEKAINHFCNISSEDLYSIPVESYNGLYDTVKEVFKEGYDLPLVQRFTILSTEFGFIPNLNEMSYGEYLDLSTYFKDMWVNMPTIMSILYRPVKRKSMGTYEIEEYNGKNNEALFLEVPMDIHYGALFFFVRLLTALPSVILKSMMDSENLPQSIKSVLERSGKITAQLSN